MTVLNNELSRFKNDNESKIHLQNYLKNHSPKHVKAIQYSGYQIADLILELRDLNSKLDILLFDPQKAETKFQKDRIINSYESIKKSFNDDSKIKNLEITFYDVPASLRGVNIDDDYLILGWYVYFWKNHESKKQLDIYGHTMPQLHINKTSNTTFLFDFFNTQFKQLFKFGISSESIEKMHSHNNQKPNYSSSAPASGS